jgi:hypothetical protein
MTDNEVMAKMGEIFADQYAIIGRLHQLRRAMASLKQTATEAVDAYSDCDNEQYTHFRWVCAESTDKIEEMEQALKEVKALIDWMVDRWTDLNNDGDE